MVVIFFVLESWIWEIFVEGDAIFSSINECYYLVCVRVCLCVRAWEETEGWLCFIEFHFGHPFCIGASSCYICPAGYQCIRAVLSDPCPAGFYCPEGTGYDTQPCPVGTIGNRTALANESECTQCPGGFYCETAGRATATGKCQEGKHRLPKSEYH